MAKGGIFGEHRLTDQEQSDKQQGTTGSHICFIFRMKIAYSNKFKVRKSLTNLLIPVSKEKNYYTLNHFKL